MGRQRQAMSESVHRRGSTENLLSAGDENDEILDEDQQEAICRELEEEGAAHEHRFRRMFLATSVVLGLLIFILHYTDHSAEKPHIANTLLMLLSLMAQARSMITQPTGADGASRSLDLSIWWPPSRNPCALAFWFSVLSGVVISIWAPGSVLKWPLNAMLGITVFHSDCSANCSQWVFKLRQGYR